MVLFCFVFYLWIIVPPVFCLFASVLPLTNAVGVSVVVYASIVFFSAFIHHLYWYLFLLFIGCEK